MNKTIFLLIFIILFCCMHKYDKMVNETFFDMKLDYPEALAIIKNGKLVRIKLVKDLQPVVSPSFFEIVVISNVRNPDLREAKVIWNSDKSFTIKDRGNGYITPPQIVFIPKIKKSKQAKKDAKKNIIISSSGLWNDIPKNQKDEMAQLTQDYLRAEKYSESILEDVYPIGVLSVMGKDKFSVEWPYNIEFSGLKIFYSDVNKKIKLLKITGYNENGVELFAKELMFSGLVEWKYTALLKKIVIIGAPKWTTFEIMGRRSFWTCEEYDDFVEQLKESVDKPGKSSSKFEDDDTTIIFNDLLEQLPADFRNLSKQKYIEYFSTLASHCNRKSQSQLDAEKLVEDQEIKNFKNYIQEQQEKTSRYKEKLMRDYEKMVEQYNVDLENQKDAQKYGITAPEFMYSKKEIDDLKKRIESIMNIPEDKLLRDCSKLESKYNKQRKNAEKWAKASIFLPFLKKKAKRESKRAEKSESNYQTYCSELVSLSYSY